jgi:ubiquitin-protein ligase
MYSVDSKKMKKWPKIIMTKYMKAQEADFYKIIPVQNNNLYSFYILLKPSSGHYAGQTHVLEFKTKYISPHVSLFPFNAPLVKFLTKIYHPNVSTDGSIYIDILKNSNQWNPQHDFTSVMTSIVLLMNSPNNAYTFNTEASDHFVKCERDYKTQISGWSIPHKELTSISNKCFKSFDDYSRNYANTNISTYLEKFTEHDALQQSIQAVYDFDVYDENNE